MKKKTMRNPHKLILASSAFLSAITAHAQITDSLIGYWEFNDNLTESSGTHAAGTHDGSPFGTIAYGAGPTTDFGQALDLTDGEDPALNDNGVFINNSSSDDPGFGSGTFDGNVNAAGGFSISFWANGFPGTWSPWIAKGGETGSLGWQVRSRSTSDDAVFTIQGTEGVIDPDVSNNAEIGQPLWRHYVATWDSAGNRRLFVDGVEDTLATLTDDIPSSDPANPDFIPGPGNAEAFDLTFGMRNDTIDDAGLPVYETFFNGLIDDVAIWERALLPSEVLLLNSNPLSVLMSAGGNDDDGDGLTNDQEAELGTNPNIADSDSDGINDGIENSKGSNPLIDNDFDDDGLLNSEETSGSINPWTTVAGVATLGATPGDTTDWCDADSDNDGIEDGEEVLSGVDGFISNPNNSDTDGDEFSDGNEVGQTPPTDPTDADSIPPINFGIIGYWQFENDLTETSGTHAPGTHDGGEIGTVAYTDGPDTDFGQSLDLSDASDNGVFVFNTSLAEPDTYEPTFDAELNEAGGFSISFWANGFPARWSPWVAKGGEGTLGWQVRRRNNEQNAIFTLRDTDGTDDPLNGTNNAGVSQPLWRHYVATWDSVGNRKIYVDGVEDTAITLTNDFSTPTGGPGNADSLDLTFGMRTTQLDVLGFPIYENFFDGLLDDIAIWNRPLTQAEVNLLSNNPVVTLLDGAVDTDGDGLLNEQETEIGTDPLLADTDGDGIDDGLEVEKGSDPLNDNDFDEDGLTNLQETSGSANPWTTVDGVATLGSAPGDPTDWCDADSDNDGIEDGEEVIAGTDGFITNPNDSDTDGDEFADGTETAASTDPTDINDFPTDWLRGLCGYWEFDDDLTDNGALGADGVLNDENGVVATTPTFAAGQFGSAVDLDSTTFQHIIVSGDESNFDATGSSLTVSAWVLVDTFDQNWQAVIAKGEDDSWRIARLNGASGATFAGGAGDTPDNADDANLNPLNDGEWHHLVGVTEDGVSSSFWVDGQLVAFDDVDLPSITDSFNPLFIGGNPDTPDPRTWNGSIDDVAVWKRALSNEEVSEIFNNGGSVQFLIDNDVTPSVIVEGEVVIESCGFDADGNFDVVASGLNPARTYQLMSTALLDGSDLTNVGETFTGGSGNTFTDIAPPTGPDAKLFYQIFDVTDL